MEIYEKLLNILNLFVIVENVFTFIDANIFPC